MSIETMGERSARSMKERLESWAQKAADPEITDAERRQIKDWAVGASIALTTFGHDDLADIADEIWNPRAGK